MPRLILVLAALVALGMGVVFTSIGWSSRKQMQRLTHLPVWNADQAMVAPLGQEGLLEGILSSDNPSLAQGFVFYFRSRLTGFHKDSSGSRRPTWESLDRQLPALIIDSRTEQIRATAGYTVTFLGSDPSWVSTETLEVGTTEKLEGLYAGHPVTLVGKAAVDARGERVFESERLVSGDAASLLAGETSGARFGLIAGGALLFVGLVLIGIAVSLG